MSEFNGIPVTAEELASAEATTSVVDRIRSGLPGRNAYERAVQMLVASDFHAFFQIAKAAYLVVRSEMPLHGCTYFNLYPSQADPFDMRFGIDSSDLRLLYLGTDDSAYTISAVFDYNRWTLIIDLRFPPEA